MMRERNARTRPGKERDNDQQLGQRSDELLFICDSGGFHPRLLYWKCNSAAEARQEKMWLGTLRRLSDRAEANRVMNRTDQAHRVISGERERGYSSPAREHSSPAAGEDGLPGGIDAVLLMQISLNLPNEAESARLCCAMLRNVLLALSVDGACTAEIERAVSEAIANRISHDPVDPGSGYRFAADFFLDGVCVQIMESSGERQFEAKFTFPRALSFAPTPGTRSSFPTEGGLRLAGGTGEPSNS